jgi:hypothetical protein
MESIVEGWILYGGDRLYFLKGESWHFHTTGESGRGYWCPKACRILDKVSMTAFNASSGDEGGTVILNSKW